MVVPGVLIPMNLVRTQAGQPIYKTMTRKHTTFMGYDESSSIQLKNEKTV